MIYLVPENGFSPLEDYLGNVVFPFISGWDPGMMEIGKKFGFVFIQLQ
jgi:hypothetical protein